MDILLKFDVTMMVSFLYFLSSSLWIVYTRLLLFYLYFHNFLNQIFPTVFFSVASNVKWTAFRIMRDEEYHLVFFFFSYSWILQILIKSIFSEELKEIYLLLKNTNSHLNRLRTQEYMCYTHQTYIFFSIDVKQKLHPAIKKKTIY